MSTFQARPAGCVWVVSNYGCKHMQRSQVLPRLCHLLILLLLTSCAVQFLYMERLTSCSKGLLEAKLPFQDGFYLLPANHGRRHASLPTAVGSQHTVPRVPVAKDFCLDTLTPGMFNPSIAVYRGEAWVVLRTQHVMPSSRWALGRNHLAQLNLSDWSILSLHDFDPWSARKGTELPCKAKDRGSPIHVWGPDDTKLFVWPGQGLWALTSGRPRMHSLSNKCCSCGQLVFQQHLVQLAREGEDLDATVLAPPSEYVPPHHYPGWMTQPAGAVSVTCAAGEPVAVHNSKWETLWGAPPLPLTISDAATVYKDTPTVEEKNWALFTSDDKLYVSYQLAPKHRVYSLNSDGRANPQHETDSRAVFAPLGRPFESLNGGPPMVMINSSVAAGSAVDSAQGYLLGVVHYHTKVAYEDSPSYYHHLIKIAPVAPFEVLELSRELGLHLESGASGKENIAFVAGLQLVMMSSQDASARIQTTSSVVNNLGVTGAGLQPYIVMSYGVADSLSRIRVLSMEEVEHLFESAPSSKKSVQEGAQAVSSPATKQDIEQQLLLSDAAGLVDTVQKHRDGAALLYWNLRHCGGDAVCTDLLQANTHVLSCWSMVPAQGTLADKERGCMCSGPKHLSLTYMPADHVVPFLERYSWLRVLFSNNGMPSKPYFGDKLVQVAVLRDPIIRYMLHIQEAGLRYNIPELRQPNMTLSDLGSVVLNPANNLQLPVPDNYMTRFFAGHKALEDYRLLSTPVTATIYDQAVHNLKQIDMVLVLEDSDSADVQELLSAVGMKPLRRAYTDMSATAAMSDPSSMPRELYGLLAARHYHDMHLYQYARTRHARLVDAWRHIKHRQQEV